MALSPRKVVQTRRARLSTLAVHYGATRAAARLARKGAPPGPEELYMIMIAELGETRFISLAVETGDFEFTLASRKNTCLSTGAKYKLDAALLGWGTPELLARMYTEVTDLCVTTRRKIVETIVRAKEPWPAYWLRICRPELESATKRDLDQILQSHPDDRWRWFARDIPDFDQFI